MWHDICIAIGLVLILEGLMPMLSPKRYHAFMRQLLKMAEANVRTMGIVMVVVGAVVVAVVKGIYGV